MAPRGVTGIAVVVAGVAGHGVTRFIIGVTFHGVDHSNDHFFVTRSIKNIKKEAIFESSYSNNFAKAEGVDTKPQRHGAITCRFMGAEVDRFAGRLLCMLG